MKIHTNYLKLFSSSLMIMAVSCLLFISSCGDNSKKEKKDITAEEVKDEMNEAADSVAAYLDQEREKALASYRSDIEHTQQQIDDLRQKLETTTAKVRKEFNARIDSLQRQQNEALQELQEFEKSSGEAQEEMRKGLDKALEEINEGIENARTEFQ